MFLDLLPLFLLFRFAFSLALSWLLFIHLDESMKKKDGRVFETTSDNSQERVPSIYRIVSDKTRNDVESDHKEHQKPKIIKRLNTQVSPKKRSFDEVNNAPAKVARSLNDGKKGLRTVTPAKSKEAKSVGTGIKVDDDFDDLEDFDLDIGVEVEDAPQEMSQEV